MEYYLLNVAGLERRLPIVRVAKNLQIASFVILGDAELAITCAQELAKRLPQADVLITAEAKGIPLVQELAHTLGMNRYIVARKSSKPYMSEAIITEVYSITTQKRQTLCLDRAEMEYINGRRVLIVDDVISTGESLKALETLVEKAGGEIVGKAAILAEGDAGNRKDIIFLESLPIFCDDRQ